MALPRSAPSWALLLVLLLGPFAAVGAAEDPFAPDASAEQQRERWIPGLGLASTGFVNERRGRVDSVEDGLKIGDSRAVFWSLALDADLLSPVFFDLPLAPRLFVHGGPTFILDNEDPVANIDDPGPPRVVTVGTRRPVSGVTNQGSATRAETRGLGWSAGAGVAFELEVMDLRFRVKPSIEWQWQKDRVRAQLTEAVSNGVNVNECIPSCRLLQIDETTNEEYHSLGPGIEIEFDGARLSDHLVLNVFASTHALAILGDRRTRIESTGSWTTDGAPAGVPDSTVTSTYIRDRWNYRFGVGLRLRWLPR